MLRFLKFVQILKFLHILENVQILKFVQISNLFTYWNLFRFQNLFRFKNLFIFRNLFQFWHLLRFRNYNIRNLFWICIQCYTIYGYLIFHWRNWWLKFFKITNLLNRDGESTKRVSFRLCFLHPWICFALFISQMLLPKWWIKLLIAIFFPLLQSM
jgi:hypothetical protein